MKILSDKILVKLTSNYRQYSQSYCTLTIYSCSNHLYLSIKTVYYHWHFKVSLLLCSNNCKNYRTTIHISKGCNSVIKVPLLLLYHVIFSRFGLFPIIGKHYLAYWLTRKNSTWKIFRLVLYSHWLYILTWLRCTWTNSSIVNIHYG